ncbi:alpha/beta hydrolase family protein [Cupriavidus pinatubonensis]|uniref:alpha/beta hydrolase family protein n=1 Tax=Cupriavidus pinatubonensis TaxID=248026 RepID=UPI00112A05AC|nr:alpha/beta fold hydrolase [Cupriavidus pinatubonensis]TPQ37908.1 acetylxylan esterase [Cupriavidus pinatubonensis]
MDAMRKGQRWVLDAFLAVGGLDVLHPDAGAIFEQIGYDSTDLKRVFGPVKAGSMLPSAWSGAAKEIEHRAQHWEERGFTRTARRLYERATLLYARTHYSILGDDPRRGRYLEKVIESFEKVIAFSDHPIERVVLPFEGHHLHGILETPPNAKKLPCVIMLPGMDMFKEDWHKLMEQRILPRGWAAFALDGPGQGESLTKGLKMSLDNYDRAITAVIDWLSAHPAIDPERIVIMGSSMGSWWATRAAAVEPRIRAIAANMSNLGDKFVLLNQAQPSFMANLMYMTGITDTEEIQALSKAMTLDDIAPKVSIPYLIITGENDELTTLDSSIGVYGKLRGPKELWIYQYEFHPIGPQSDEWLTASLDWLEHALEDCFAPKHELRTFITKQGEYLEGSGEPPWWHP